MADHFDGKRYFLPGHKSRASFADMLKWQFTAKRARWPARVDNVPAPPPPQRVFGDALHATWIGHATVLIQTAGLNILTDPFFSRRASPTQLMGPKRVRAPGVALEDLPPIDVVLLSHNHYDHMDAPALKALAQAHNLHVMTPLGNTHYISRRLGSAGISELDWGQSLSHKGMRITLTPARHWSRRSFADTNRALWGAFVIETEAGMIYFGADTGFGEGETFRAVRQQFGSPRLSLLPIGAYEPRWFMHPMHMNPAEAVAAHRILESRASLGIHHGTIQLTDEAIDAPVAALHQALADAGISRDEFRVTEAGHTWVVT